MNHFSNFTKTFLLIIVIFLGGFSSVFASGVDTTFDPGTGVTGGMVLSSEIQSDGKIIIGGTFTAYDGVSRVGIARINTDGSLDTSFDPGTGAPSDFGVRDIAIQSDGKIVIGGNFAAYDGVTRQRIARINTDGSLDTSFDPGAGLNFTGVRSMTVQSDDKVIIVGDFSSYDGTTRGRIARINTDGSLDTSFDPGSGFSNIPDFITVQTDGKIIVTGSFTTYDGVDIYRIARINTDGSLDTSFVPSSYVGADGAITSAAIQSDGKIIIVGSFIAYEGSTRNRIARINTDGSLDTSFVPSPGFNTESRTAVIQPDGKIIVVGNFGSYSGTTRNRIARINTDGSLDTSFDPGAGFTGGSFMATLSLQGDGRVVVGGDFTGYDGTALSKITRIFFVPYVLDYTAGTGGSITGDTLQYVDPGLDGTSVTAVPNSGYTFSGWSDSSTQNPRTDLNIAGDIQITANFAPYRTVDYYSNGGGTIGGDINQSFPDGEDATPVVAFPDPGYRFLYWDDSSTDNIRQDTNVTTDISMGANFDALMCGTVAVGSGPTYSVSSGSKLYVLNLNDNTVSVIDTNTNTPSETILVGANPSSAVVVGSKLYVLNFGENTVTVINTATDSVIETLTVGAYGPTSPIVVGDNLYILNQVGTANSNSSISIIDTNTDTVTEVDVTAIDSYINSVFAVFVGGNIYVYNNEGSIGVFNTTSNTLTQTVSIGVYPTAGVVVNDEIFLIDNGGGLVHVFDTLTNAIIGSPIIVGSGPNNGTLAGNNLYVMNATDTTVSVIDITDYSVTTIADVGANPYSGTLIDTELFVVNLSDNTVSVIDTLTDTLVGSPITVGYGPTTATLVGIKLYVNNNSDTTVSIIDTTTKALVPCATTYSAAYLSDANGSVTGSTFQTVAEGADGTAVTAVASSGYEFVEWSDNSTQNPRTDTNIVSNIVVTATFQAVSATTYDLTYTAGAGGTLTGDTTQTVNENTDGTAVTAVPDSGYEFVEWSDNSTQNPRTDTNVTANVTVSATFQAVVGTTYNLIYTAGTGGTLTGDTMQTVSENANGTAVTAVPSSGYTFTRWSDNSTQNPRTDTSVTSNVTVSAVFTAIRSSRSSGGGGITYGCKDPKATNYNAFSSSKPSLCKYATTPVVPITPGTLGKPGICSVNQLLTQNLKTGARNGKYHPYTKAFVKEAHILQAHMNRLGFSSGKEDGILGPISDRAIKRMQTFLGTKADGYVGPVTRGLLNNSCGK